MNDTATNDPRLYAIPDIHGHAKGEHKAFIDERPIPLSARMLFLWFFHACRRGWPRFLMVSDHMNYLTFEDPAAINLVRRALKLAQAGDLYGAAETASVEVGHAAVVSEGLRRGMRYSIGAEVDNDPRSRPDAQNIVDAMKPDGMIRSVHFLTIDHPTHGPNWNWPFDNPEFAAVFDVVGTAKTWELYMATLLDAVERLPGNILGHFYVPAIFGHWPDEATLEDYENQIVEACEARGMAIEFNTRFLYRDHTEEEKAKYLAANRRLLTKCKAKNVGVAIGSDAHSPKDQGRAFETVLALLDECAINELIFPIAGRLARVALRVERKVEAVPEPPAVPLEERRAARKARPVESAGRDEVLTAPPPAPMPAPTVETPDSPPKVKARPRRSRAKSSAASPALDSSAVQDAAERFNGQVTSEDGVPEPQTDRSASLLEAEPLAQDPELELPEPELPEPELVVVTEPVLGDDIEELVSDPDFAPIVVTVAAEPGEATESAAAISADPAAMQPASATLAQPSVDWPPTEEADDDQVGAEPEGGRNSRPKSTLATARASAPKAIGKAKPAAKKTTKTPAKPSLKKAAAKKSAAKKAAAKKALAKKTAPKAAGVKKVAAKKAAVRPAGTKKSASKKSAAKKVSPKKPAQRRR